MTGCRAVAFYSVKDLGYRCNLRFGKYLGVDYTISVPRARDASTSLLTLRSALQHRVLAVILPFSIGYCLFSLSTGRFFAMPRTQ